METIHDEGPENSCVVSILMPPSELSVNKDHEDFESLIFSLPRDFLDKSSFS